MLHGGEAVAHEEEEHYQTAARTLQSVFEEVGQIGPSSLILELPGPQVLEIPIPLWEGHSFAWLVRDYAKDDKDPARYHRYLESVQDQLTRVGVGVLQAAEASCFNPLIGNDSPGTWPDVQSFEKNSLGVVGNYLLHHWLALRYAQLAANRPPVRTALMVRALVYEARAQGYLLDAFSASHMLLPNWNLLSWLHPVNLRVLHDSYRMSGVFVINSRYQVWQTFGDGVLKWYPYSFGQVSEACKASLLEVIASLYVAIGSGAPSELDTWVLGEYPGGDGWVKAQSWLEVREGSEYYGELRMPSLLRIPMPITAAWSVRSGEDFSPPGADPEVKERTYFPQLAEAAYHDPTLEPYLTGALYSLDAVGSWLVLPQLATQTPEAIVKNDPDVASVRYVQQFSKTPSYKGILVIGGAGYMFHGPGIGGFVSLGAGWGFVDEVVRMRWLPSLRRGSFEVRYLGGFQPSDGDILGGAVTIQLELPTFADLHAEAGYAWGIQAPMARHGPTLGIGVVSNSLRIPGTYLGALARLKYEALFLEEISGGVFLEVVVH